MEKWKKIGCYVSVLCAAMTCLLWPAVSYAEQSAGKVDDTMGHGSAADIVVAKVNGKVINMSQLLQEMAEISSTKHGSQEVSPLLAEKIKQEATDKLVIEELALQVAGAKIKSVPSGRLDSKIQAVRKKYKDEDTFQKYIKDEFGGMDGFRKQMERLLALEIYIAQEFESKVSVSDQEVQKAYDEAKEKFFVTDEFVQVNDLIFFLDPADSGSAGVIAKIKKAIIDQHNNDPARYPSDGTFTVEKNKPLDKNKDKLLFEAARVLKEYAWSEPINVDGNLHIVQLIGYKPAVNKSLKEVSTYLKTELSKQKLQEMLNTWMAGLKNGANIEIVDLTR